MLPPFDEKYLSTFMLLFLGHTYKEDFYFVKLVDLIAGDPWPGKLLDVITKVFHFVTF
jgi:hypothetical protein